MITKVGPPDASDMPRKRGFLSRVMRWLYRLSGAAFLMHNGLFLSPRAMRRAAPYLLDDEMGEAKPVATSAGIPDANIGDAERHWAALRLKRDRDGTRGDYTAE